MNEFKRPESILVVVYTEASEVLLLRRRIPNDFWQSVTGSLEWGESAQAAAQRELQEETGIGAEWPVEATDRRRCFEILPAWRHRYAPNVLENCEYEFRLCLPDRLAVYMDPAEHLEYCWLPLDQAVRRVSSWSNRAALERLLEERS